MQTTPHPEIEKSEIKAARNFLVTFRDEERKAQPAASPSDAQGLVPIRNGISRARLRSLKNSA